MKLLLNTYSQLSIVLVSVVFLASPGIAHAEYANQADYDVMDAAAVSLDNFVTIANDENTTQEQVTQAAYDAESSLEEAAKHTYSTDINDLYTEATKEFASAAGALAVHLAGVEIVFTGSEDEATAYFDTYNQLSDDFYAAGDAINVSIDEADRGETTLYLLALVGTVIVSIGTLIWARHGWARYSTEKRRARMALVKSSLWPLAGALITFVTWVYADKIGGQYYVVWGLILFGFAAYIREILQYRTMVFASPVSNSTSEESVKTEQ